MTIMLSIVLGLTSIIITGASIAGQFSDAVRAFSAADTGIERGLFNVYKSSNCAAIPSTNIQGDTSYSYSVSISGSCPNTPTVMESIGQYSSPNTGYTRRKIQVSY